MPSNLVDRDHYGAHDRRMATYFYENLIYNALNKYLQMCEKTFRILSKLSERVLWTYLERSFCEDLLILILNLCFSQVENWVF